MSIVNPFDAGIISFLNHFAGRSYAFDMFFVLCSNYLVRAAGIVPVLWWAWFRDGEGKSEKRDYLAFGAIACVFALIVSRVLSAVLPFRPRPIHDPTLHFQVPYGEGTGMLLAWSSFPSDHAALYFALATCIYFVSHRLGIFALCWAFFITSLPRVYLGIHYPTDIIAGALLGVGVGLLARNDRLRTKATAPVMRWHERSPGSFYALVFLFCVQLATAFESVLLFKDYAKAVTAHAIRLLH